MAHAVQALLWRGDTLEILDQRRLPQLVVHLSCTDAQAVAAAIRDMVVRGAPAIGCAAAFGMALQARKAAGQPGPLFRETLREAAAVLRASRPTAVNLSWAVARMQEVIDATGDLEPRVIAGQLEARALQLFEADIRTNRAMGAAGAALLEDGSRILTYCNTGALATAGHGTALGVIRSAVEQGKRISVIACETRPYLQGARLTAWELANDGVPVVIVTDNMAGHLMQRGEVDAVIVGADRVAANGDTANKIGTYTVAVLARHHGIPFYVAAPLSTLDMELADGSGIPIEQRSSEEVKGFGSERWAPAGVEALHPAFDVTPAGLISALITERGVVRNPDAAGLRQLFDQAPTS